MRLLSNILSDLSRRKSMVKFSGRDRDRGASQEYLHELRPDFRDDAVPCGAQLTHPSGYP